MSHATTTPIATKTATAEFATTVYALLHAAVSVTATMNA